MGIHNDKNNCIIDVLKLSESMNAIGLKSQWFTLEVDMVALGIFPAVVQAGREAHWVVGH